MRCANRLCKLEATAVLTSNSRWNPIEIHVCGACRVAIEGKGDKKNGSNEG